MRYKAMTKMKLLDAVIGGEGMALIYDSVKVKDGKLATNLLELVVGILLTSIGGVMMGVRSIDQGFRWFKKREEES